MINMGKNIFKKLAILAMVLTLATTSLVAGTYAKYTTTITGTDTARVAKFDVTAMGATAGIATFNLFATINDTLNGEVETDVSGSKLIAPGTTGSFDIVLVNNSEVTVQYEISFTGDLKTVPLQFSIDGVEWKTTLAEINIDATEIATGTEVTKTVYWKWVYSSGEAGDIADTALGTAETLAQPSVTATVTFTQVD